MSDLQTFAVYDYAGQLDLARIQELDRIVSVQFDKLGNVLKLETEKAPLGQLERGRSEVTCRPGDIFLAFRDNQFALLGVAIRAAGLEPMIYWIKEFRGQNALAFLTCLGPWFRNLWQADALDRQRMVAQQIIDCLYSESGPSPHKDSLKWFWREYLASTAPESRQTDQVGPEDASPSQDLPPLDSVENLPEKAWYFPQGKLPEDLYKLLLETRRAGATSRVLSEHIRALDEHIRMLKDKVSGLHDRRRAADETVRRVSRDLTVYFQGDPLRLLEAFEELAKVIGS